MATTVEELIVAMRSEGMGETQDDIEDVESSFDESSEKVEDTGDEMEGFTNKFSGAMGTIMAGLAVASAGLLSQVPVIGEAFAGLASVLRAVAFQMDQVLRPILEPVANGFFDLADAIFNAEGPLGTLVAILATVAAVALPLAFVFGSTIAVLAGLAVAVVLLLSELGLLQPIVNAVKNAFVGFVNLVRTGDGVAGTLARTITVLTGSLVALVAIAQTTSLVLGALSTAYTVAAGATAVFTVALGALSTVAGIAAAALTTIAGILSLPVVVIAALIAAVVALVAIFLTDFMGIRSTVVGVIGDVIDALTGLAGTFADVFTDLASDAIQWGIDIMKQLAQGIKDAATAPVDAAQDAIGGVKNAIGFDVRSNDQMAQRWGEDMVSEFAVGIDRGVRMEIPGQAVEPQDGGTSQPASRGRNMRVELDGRRVDEGTSRHEGRETSSRGRFR